MEHVPLYNAKYVKYNTELVEKSATINNISREDMNKFSMDLIHFAFLYELFIYNII